MLLRYLGLFFCLCFSTVSAAKEMAAVELQAIQWFQGPLNTSQPTPLWVSQSLTPVEAFSLTGAIMSAYLTLMSTSWACMSLISEIPR